MLLDFCVTRNNEMPFTRLWERILQNCFKFWSSLVRISNLPFTAQSAPPVKFGMKYGTFHGVVMSACIASIMVGLWFRMWFSTKSTQLYHCRMIKIDIIKMFRNLHPEVSLMLMLWLGDLLIIFFKTNFFFRK